MLYSDVKVAKHPGINSTYKNLTLHTGTAVYGNVSLLLSSSGCRHEQSLEIITSSINYKIILHTIKLHLQYHQSCYNGFGYFPRYALPVSGDVHGTDVIDIDISLNTTYCIRFNIIQWHSISSHFTN